jgi:uncharacterized protein
MDYVTSSSRPAGTAQATRAPTSIKIVIAGGFGVGKTTFVTAVSEIMPLTPEATMTSLSEGTDDTHLVAAKTTTTVAMDFGRITIDGDVLLYLFGTPGQDRFWFMWDDLARGAIGAVVLVDTRRLADSFAAVDYFERRRVPFVIAVNHFQGTRPHATGEVREALAISDEVPVVLCDARLRGSARDTLVRLVEHAIAALSHSRR